MATNTATSSTTHTGNGSTNAFAISFSFLTDSEVDVTVAGVLKTINTHRELLWDPHRELLWGIIKINDFP